MDENTGTDEEEEDAVPLVVTTVITRLEVRVLVTVSVEDDSVSVQVVVTRKLEADPLMLSDGTTAEKGKLEIELDGTWLLDETYVVKIVPLTMVTCGTIEEWLRLTEPTGVSVLDGSREDGGMKLQVGVIEKLTELELL